MTSITITGQKPKPATRPCSRCGQELEPKLVGYIDSEPWYTYAHACPKLAQEYRDRIREIANNSGFTNEKKAEEIYRAGLMNSMGI